jgi:hypothetical protein
MYCSEYMQVVTIQPEWQDVLRKYGVRTSLADKESPLSTLLRANGGWHRVFQGDVEDVFVRKGSNGSQLDLDG